MTGRPEKLPLDAPLTVELKGDTARWLLELIQSSGADVHDGRRLSAGYEIRRGVERAMDELWPDEPIGTHDPVPPVWHTDDGPTDEPIQLGQLCRPGAGPVMVITHLRIGRYSDGSWSEATAEGKVPARFQVGSFSGVPTSELRKVEWP